MANMYSPHPPQSSSFAGWVSVAVAVLMEAALWSFVIAFVVAVVWWRFWIFLNFAELEDSLTPEGHPIRVHTVDEVMALAMNWCFRFWVVLTPLVYLLLVARRCRPRR